MSKKGMTAPLDQQETVPQVKQAVAGKRSIALFDFDDTLIQGDSIKTLVKRMYQQKLISTGQLARLLWYTLLWIIGRKPVEIVKSLALSPLNRMGAQEAAACCKRFAEEDLLPHLYPDAVEQMRFHKDRGDVVMLVSASPACYLKHLQPHLPVDVILGTQTNDHYQVSHNLIREKKPMAIQRWLKEAGITPDWALSSAYGDSANDLPMLRMAGNPHLVNPNPKTRRLGEGIPVLHWGQKA